MSSQDEPPKRLGSLIGLAARQWRRAVDLRLQPFDLTEATWMPLIHLARSKEPMRQKDLAAALALDSSSVVRVLNTLETAGLIERGEDEEDRRAKAIIITSAGRALARKLVRLSEDLERELLAGFEPSDVAATKRLLERISDQLLHLNAKGRRE
ncbi:MAG: hypothetical protein BGP04_00740 [Rhizobiales bacterium 62-17]|nr:MarR family transcriptional regulator [Hyphomicrobiales bacterium]OJY04606.1 MAG: hypothetical protein BGP04_00740 [Rhizobiales bacterium 62-17]